MRQSVGVIEFERQYLDLVKFTLDGGHPVRTRNGIRRTTYGAQLRLDLTEGFPLMTTKFVSLRTIAAELCWFLNGNTNTKQLNDWGVHIWDANAGDGGELGPIYGYQWRNYGGSGLDQISRSIQMLRRSPESTRNVVIAFNPVDMEEMKLPPCHFGFQVHSVDGGVTLQVSMRSVDLLVGLPYNIASYALLTHLFSHLSGKVAKELIMDLGNVHVYEEHVDNARVQLQREPLPLPTLQITGEISDDLIGLEPTQFKVIGYQNYGKVAYEMIA